MRTIESTNDVRRRTFLQAAYTAVVAVGRLATGSACGVVESDHEALFALFRQYGVTVVTVLPTLFLVWGDRLEDGWLADAP